MNGLIFFPQEDFIHVFKNKRSMYEVVITS